MEETEWQLNLELTIALVNVFCVVSFVDKDQGKTLIASDI
jgi:hypothetical protein